MWQKKRLEHYFKKKLKKEKEGKRIKMMISMKNLVKKNLEKSDSSMDNDDNKYKCK